jgi:hypothetical protein
MQVIAAAVRAGQPKADLTSEREMAQGPATQRPPDSVLIPSIWTRVPDSVQAIAEDKVDDRTVFVGAEVAARAGDPESTTLIGVEECPGFVNTTLRG